MPSSSKHLNYYGFLGLFVLLVCVAGFFILQEKSCSFPKGADHDKLKPIQIAGAITGGILFILSFFNIANVLYDIKIIFFVVIVAIIAVAGVMFWGAYIAFVSPCVGLTKVLSSDNSFEAEDWYKVTVMVLDILGGLMLLSIGGTFAKRL